MKKHLAISIACGLLAYTAAAFAEYNIDIYSEYILCKRNDLDKIQLVKNTTDQASVSSNKLEFVSEPDCCNTFKGTKGYRIGVIYTTNRNSCFEINYLHLDQSHVDHEIGDAVTNPIPYGAPAVKDIISEFLIHTFIPLHPSNRVREEYRVAFCAGEVNYWRYLTPRTQRLFSFAPLVGFHYFRLEEKLQHSLYKTCYVIHTLNDMFGLQLGSYLQINLVNAVYGNLIAKVGGMANSLRSKKSLQEKNEQIKPGFFAEVSAQVGWTPARWIKFYVGYQILFLYGIGTAPKQIDQKPHHIHHDSRTIFQGVSGGIAFTF
jgi:hypothetical protein